MHKTPLMPNSDIKIIKDNCFPQHHLLSYLYRKSSRWESQQSLNKCFIHSPDLLQEVRIPKIIWWHHVLNFKESMKIQAHKLISRKINPVVYLSTDSQFAYPDYYCEINLLYSSSSAFTMKAPAENIQISVLICTTAYFMVNSLNIQGFF